MATFLVPVSLTGNELRNIKLQALATEPDPAVAQVYYDTSVSPGRLRYHNGTAWVNLDGNVVAALDDLTDVVITAAANGDTLVHDGTNWVDENFNTLVQANRLDQLAAPTAAVSLNSQKITSLATPTDGTDAATKSYADALRQGMDVKDSVRAASTANLTLSGTQTVDGIALVAAERILVKNQTDPIENGIYLVAAGAWTRASDADASGEISPGTVTYVEAGTAAGGQQWICSATGADPWVPGTTTSTWTQFTSGVPVGYIGQTSITTLGTITTGVWNGTTVAIAYGGTGATTAAAARTNLGATTKYAADVGGAAAVTVTHNLNTRDLTVTVRANASPYDVVYPDIEYTDVNSLTIRFTTAPAGGAYRCIVTG